MATLLRQGLISTECVWGPSILNDSGMCWLLGSFLLLDFKAHLFCCSRLGDLTNIGLEAEKSLRFAQFSCPYSCMAERRG